MDTMILKMPAVALRGMVILPGMIAHFDISREKIEAEIGYNDFENACSGTARYGNIAGDDCSF